MRIGVLGSGHWGKKIFLTLSTMLDVDPFILDRENNKNIDLDGVIIATPSATHCSSALPYIERGIPTFIEKPMVVSIDQYNEIERAALKYKTSISVGYIYFFNPYIEKIKRKMPDFSSAHLVGRSTYFRTDTSVLWDWLPHDLTVIKAISGNFPHFVSGEAIKGNNNLVSAHIEFKTENATISSEISWDPLAGERTLFFSNGKNTIFYNDKSKVFLMDGVHSSFSSDGDIHLPPLFLELREFIYKVKNNIFSMNDLELTKEITQTIDRIENTIRIKDL